MWKNALLTQEVSSVEQDAIDLVVKYLKENNLDKIKWAEFQKKFQRIANKFPSLWLKLRDSSGVMYLTSLENTHVEAPDYGISDTKYHEPENQFRDAEQMVLQINRGAGAEAFISQYPILQEYLQMVAQGSSHSGHPATPNTVGWLRLDTVNEEYILIDEIQSDLINGISQAKLIIANENYETFLDAYTHNPHILQKIQESGLDPRNYRGMRNSFIQKGFTQEALDEIKSQLTELFKDWAEVGIATVLKYARRKGIKKVLIHSEDTLMQRDPDLSKEKAKMMYTNLAKGFGFKEEIIETEEINGKFLARTARLKSNV
jgi:hypothetical protein